jgi:hypothetical protein
MSTTDLLIQALRITASKWLEGISETAFRRWNRSNVEQQRAANAQVLLAIATAFEKLEREKGGRS